ncbi:MAG: TPM domain-containing protein [Nanobdellota archaeon]
MIIKLNPHIFTFILLLLVIPFVSAIPVDDVKLDGYVNDYVGVLSESDRAELSVIMKTLHENDKAQMSIVIVDSLEGLTKEQYALEIAHENLGDTESDNGLLLLVAMEERKYRIEVGYGLEGVLNDAKVGRFGREYFVPHFKQDDFGTGLLQFTKRIYIELTGDTELSAVAGTTPLQQAPQAPWWSRLGIMPFIVFFFIIRGILGAIFSKSSSGRRNSDDSFAAAMIASMFMRGGGGGLGGAGGGFGGFGGGGFGGGGAGGGF